MPLETPRKKPPTITRCNPHSRTEDQTSKDPILRRRCTRQLRPFSSISFWLRGTTPDRAELIWWSPSKPSHRYPCRTNSVTFVACRRRHVSRGTRTRIFPAATHLRIAAYFLGLCAGNGSQLRSDRPDQAQRHDCGAQSSALTRRSSLPWRRSQMNSPASCPPRSSVSSILPHAAERPSVRLELQL